MPSHFETGQRALDDRRTVEAASAALRRAAAQDQRASGVRPEVAFTMAGLFDAMALQLRELPTRVRADVVASAVEITRKIG